MGEDDERGREGEEKQKRKRRRKKKGQNEKEETVKKRDEIHIIQNKASFDSLHENSFHPSLHLLPSVSPSFPPFLSFPPSLHTFIPLLFYVPVSLLIFPITYLS